MDPLTQRVAERFARRTIPFDTRAVSLLGSGLAERAIDKLVRTLPADSGIEWELDRNEVIVRDKLDMRDVRGLPKTIDVLVRHRRMQNDRPTAGGHYEPDAEAITLFLNSEWTPQTFQTELHAIQGVFATFLVHEVTHALDVLPKGVYEGAGGDQAAYYNQPAEFRAFTKQIVTDILTRWKMILRKHPTKSGAALIEAALASSPNYAKVKEYFNRRNHQRLRLIVVREIETIAKPASSRESSRRASSMWLELALDEMAPVVMEWVHRPSAGKEEVFSVYKALAPKIKSAYDADVRAAFARAHGAKTIAYRYKDRPGNMGGMSLSSTEPTYLAPDLYSAYEVHADDVLVHWAQDEMPLSSKAFGHEKEMILRKDAKPTLVARS